MTLYLGILILVGTLVAGCYLYVATGRLQREIRRTTDGRGNGHGRRAPAREARGGER